MKYKVGAVQIKMKELDLEYNLSVLEKYVRLAAADGARLILLPETCTLGSLCTTRDHIYSYAETIPGKTTDFFSELCKELKVSIAFGMVERDLESDLIFNSVAFIGCNGELKGSYRKTHLFSTETNFLVPGNNGITVFDTEFGTIGILICEDVVHFESARLQALQGMDVLLMATCWVDNGPDDAWRTRAAENGVYMVCADWWSTNNEGKDYGGGSCIISPQGHILSEMKIGDGYVVSEIDTSLILRDQILRARKKGKYHWLLQDSYLWGSNGLNLPKPQISEVMALAYDYRTVDEYLEKTASKVRELKNDTKLVVLPALSDGTSWNYIIQLIQNIIINTTEDNYFVVTCKTLERDITVLFNKNKIIHTYQGIHQMPGEYGPESPDQFSTIDTTFGRIGLLSDNDMFFPEALRCMARKGVDLVCVSGNWRREQLFILNERRLFSDCAVLASLADGEGAYAYFGSPYTLEIEEGERGVLSRLDTGNDFIRNKIDIRKARLDLYEGLLTYPIS